MFPDLTKPHSHSLSFTCRLTHAFADTPPFAQMEGVIVCGVRSVRGGEEGESSKSSPVPGRGDTRREQEEN